MDPPRTTTGAVAAAEESLERMPLGGFSARDSSRRWGAGSCGRGGVLKAETTQGLEQQSRP